MRECDQKERKKKPGQVDRWKISYLTIFDQSNMTDGKWREGGNTRNQFGLCGFRFRLQIQPFVVAT